MNNYNILQHKDWTCEFSKTSFSLTHLGNELIDSYAGYSELISALSSYLCRKSTCNCSNNNFRIENDQKEQSVLITKNETQGFLNFLQDVSLQIEKNITRTFKVKEMNFLQAKKGLLSNFSLN
jgi:hypothetical protein